VRIAEAASPQRQAKASGTVRSPLLGAAGSRPLPQENHHPHTGGIALQVRGGGDYTKQFVRYRNVCIKVLE
jgi:hypothetical protein